MNERLFHVRQTKAEAYHDFTSAKYVILLFEGAGGFCIDFTSYAFDGPTVLFLTPYQHLEWQADTDIVCHELTFHGDFYCIEYHKKEVACNGLLFNNIYLQPHLPLSEKNYRDLHFYFDKISEEVASECDGSEAVLKAYLQLTLALCSRDKKQMLEVDRQQANQRHEETVALQKLFDKYYLQQRNVAFYAGQIGITVGALSKRTRTYFGKTPSQLIQDRVILEAKRQLHLTHKPVKEIAAELCFDDEFYFSRYFKKQVGLSPSHYREQVGISIVANLSM